MAQITLNSSGVASSGSLLLQTNGTTTQATLDTSGNLGLGVTPSAWTSSFRALDMYGTGSVASASDNMNITNNAYFNGTNYIYKANGAANRYAQSGGIHYWFTGASGTAGNAISFTQAMTLDASGNLGIGATSPGGKLDIRSSGLSGTDKIILQITDSTNTTFQINQTTSYSQIMANNALTFSNGTTERARIDSSGNLLVGTTSTLLSAGIGVKIQPAGYATTPTVSCVGSSSSNTADTYHVYSTGAAAFRFYVGYGGTISATSTSITGLSDVSLKENIRDLETGLSEVLNLKPRRFDWKAETEISEKNVAGFIAQEVEEVLPELVYEYKYSAEETKKSLKMGDILPTLVKAIQEQQQIITQLQADVAALKGQA